MTARNRPQAVNVTLGLSFTWSLAARKGRLAMTLWELLNQFTSQDLADALVASGLSAVGSKPVFPV